MRGDPVGGFAAPLSQYRSFRTVLLPMTTTMQLPTESRDGC